MTPARPSPDWLGETARNWTIRRLKHVGQLQYGDALAGDVRDDDGEVPVYGSNGPVGSHSHPNTGSPVIVVGRKGSYGKVAYVDRSVFAIDTTYFIDESSSRADLKWLYYALQVLGLDTASQDTGVPGLSREFAHERHVPVPPLDEQRRIAAFLDHETRRIDELVQEQERLVALIAEKRTATISRVVSYGIDDQVELKDSGVPFIGSIPRHWSVMSLKRDLCFVTSGSRGWAAYYADEGPLFIRIGNLTRSMLSLDLNDCQHVNVPHGTEGERTRVRPGDLLFSITAYLGSVAVAPDDLGPAYVSQHVALARLRGERLLSSWVAFVTLSSVGKAYLASQGYGGTKIQLSLDDIRDFVLPVPPLSEQRSIVGQLTRELTALEALRVEATRSMEHLRERRSALITAAVTGQMDLRDWSPPDESASRVEGVASP